MKRKFTADLSVRSIEKLKKDLEHYRDVELPNKCRELSSRLADIGIKTARAKIDESPLGRYVSLRVDIDPDKTGCKAILIATGEIKKAAGYEPFNLLLAIEFGAGIRYNPIPNPLTAEMGYGVGSYGEVNAFRQEGWYYWDEKSQEWRHSYGVKATMPMYNADIEIIQSVVKIAKEVFR